MSEKVIFWFRRDLRLADNAGLYAALKSGYPVIPLFIFDTNILSKLEDKKDMRVDFILQALLYLDKELQQYGSQLCIQYGDPKQVFNSLIVEHPIKAVYTNRDYEPYANERDTAVKSTLLQKGINFLTFKDQVILEPGEVLKSDGKPYTVFTPYAKSWKNALSELLLTSFPSEKILNYASNGLHKTVSDLSDLGFSSTGVEFTTPDINEQLIEKYHTTRDIPSLDGTTRLGVHIRFGTISIRQLVRIAFATNETWLNELIWREFFMSIIFYFPRVVLQSFKPAYDFIEWRNNEEEFNRWCTGTTGYPIIDAGMRELFATGFMHNRVRMITASFLTKHLLIDWRWGEAWFARLLLDYDLSANNGNWQWAAGSGCDAAPYFRIFNPYEQTKKFDPMLSYIHKWIPELESDRYPMPIVEHSFARKRALETYKLGLEQIKSTYNEQFEP
jgi:deoxyribodipyrimidine photo-lyase